VSSQPILRLRQGAPTPADLRGGVVAIGNFDGVHRGHQTVLRCALDEGHRRGLPVLALTFEPHPRAVCRPEEPMFTLTPPGMRARPGADAGSAGRTRARGL